jgi:uncharacterized protein
VVALIEIREIEKIRLKNPIIIEGFPGIGMVGTISASYLSEKLGMKLAGYLASNHFPPVAAIHDYTPVSPARIYASEKHNLIVLFSEFVIPAEIVLPLTEKIIEWAQKKKARAIYSLAGVAVPETGKKIFGIASTKQMQDVLKKNGVELIKEGATQGVSGVLIAECAAKKINAANLMAQTQAPLDPGASAVLLDKLSEIIGIKVDTKPLATEGQKIEEKIKEALNKMKSMHDNYKEMEANPMYA